jgi:dTDP-4-dehydrorhamnose 3,5-epimerase
MENSGPRPVYAQAQWRCAWLLSETFRQDAFDAAAGPSTFVQDNHASSGEAGVIRGLHFQRPPRAQGKLVRVVRGAIFDVAVDIRRENWRQLWVPIGFAHGYCTLEPNTEVIYKVTADEGGLAFDDPALAIDWPVAPEEAQLSERDRRHRSAETAMKR